jgi:hypothetical protein
MVLTSAKSKFIIVCPYSATMALHSLLTTPDAPIAWLIMVITVYNNKSHGLRNKLVNSISPNLFSVEN